jgi:hypothetical protein
MIAFLRLAPLVPRHRLLLTHLLLALACLITAPSLAHAAAAIAAPEAAEELSTTEADYPHLIKASIWPRKDGFPPGDKVTVTSIRGTLPKLKQGGAYLVQGTYTLASELEGVLQLTLGPRQPSGWRPTAKAQRYKIEKGSGTFVLAAKMDVDGKFHVTIYLPDKSAPARKDKNGNPLPPPLRGQGGIEFDNC